MQNESLVNSTTDTQKTSAKRQDRQSLVRKAAGLLFQTRSQEGQFQVRLPEDWYEMTLLRMM